MAKVEAAGHPKPPHSSNFSDATLITNSNSAPEISIYKDDLTFNEKEKSALFRIKLDARNIIVDKIYPQSIKIELYKINPSTQKKIPITTASKTIMNAKHAKNVGIKFALENINTNSIVYLDLYNAHNEKVAGYQTFIEVLKTTTGSETAVEEAQCSGSSNFGDCQLQYILNNLKFEAAPRNSLSTLVKKQLNGTYTVSIPVMTRNLINARKKTKGKASTGGGGNISDDSSVDMGNSNISFYDDSILRSTFGWNETESSLEVKFPGLLDSVFDIDSSGRVKVGTSSDDAYLSVRGGDANTAGFQLNPGSLTTNPVDGALEYDGDKLYFTKGTTRTELGSGGVGPAGPAGSTGAQGPQGIQGPAGPAGTATAAGADSYFQFNDAGNLGGNAALAFTKASKTLSIAADAPFDINSTSLSIADTNITLDGASTTFTQTTGAIYMTPANGSNMQVNLLGTSDFIVGINKFTVDNNGSVAIGPITPNQLLTINGAMSIRETAATTASANFGKLYVNSGNSKLYFMDDSGSAYNLTNGAVAGGGSGTPAGANTYFQFNDSGSFAGNGALAFTKASKTLSIAADAPFDINSTSVSIADTNITLDGASTTFTQTTGAIYMTPANGSSMQVNLLGTSDFIVGINKFTVDNNGSVAIGPITPNQLLTINGAMSIRETAATSASANFGKLYVNSGNSKLYFMDDSGSSYNLTNGAVAASSIGGSNKQIQFNNSGSFAGSASLTWNANVLSAPTIKTADGSSSAPSYSFTSAANSGMYNDGVGGISFSTNSSTRLVIEASAGNIGIGDVSPTNKLTVNGDLGIDNGNLSSLAIKFNNDLDTGIYGPSANGIGLVAGGVERMTIKNANVGIGYTSPSSKLDVNGSINSNGLIMNHSLISNTSAATVNINWNSGNRQIITLDQNLTFTYTAPASSGVAHLSLVLVQDATGSRTVTWPAGVKWPGGATPVLSTAPNSIDILSCLYANSTYYCQVTLDFN